jgi:hypothetical protein
MAADAGMRPRLFSIIAFGPARLHSAFGGIAFRTKQTTHTMKRKLRLALTAGTLLALAGCATSSTAQKPERGPNGTIAYLVEVESSEPGAQVEANNDYIGKTPCTLKIFGDKDGTFHNFGSYHYTVKAYPVRPGEQPRTKDFRTGGWFTPEDRIPKKIFFDFGPVPEPQK